MSGNTEPTSNSIKFAPMPMSVLLANLMPLQSHEDSPDCSFTSEDESDNSVGVTVAKKPTPIANKQTKFSSTTTSKVFVTPNVKSQQKDSIKIFASEKKPYRNHENKENEENWISNQTYPNKDSHIQSAEKKVVNSQFTDVEAKKSNLLLPPLLIKPSISSNMKSLTSVQIKTPEMIKVPNSTQKQKISTPVIKCGIRKYTPGSARKSHQKKTPVKAEMLQRRDKVRCELFTPQQNDKSSHSVNPPSRLDQSKAKVPETPMNRKPIPSTYAATPSYPQGAFGNNTKKLFKTISVKDKKYIFIKKLGTGGSSEVYKVCTTSNDLYSPIKDNLPIKDYRKQ